MSINTKGKKTSLQEDAMIYAKRDEDNITGKQRWKSLSGKERRTQFKDYYLQPLIIGLFVVCAAVFFIYHDFIAKKDIIYDCAIINEFVAEEPLTKFSEDFISYIGHDNNKEQASFHTYFIDPELASENGVVPATDLQHISTKIYAAALDSMITDQGTFLTYCKSNMIMDLNHYLTKEELKKLEDSLYRPDDKTLNPENKPYGIFINTSQAYNSLFKETKRRVEQPVLGILQNSENKDRTRELLYYLFPDKLQK